MEEKKELNSSKSDDKKKRTICGLGIGDIIIFAFFGFFNMKVAFLYLVVISSLNIIKSIMKEYTEEIKKHKKKIPFYDNSEPKD